MQCQVDGGVYFFAMIGAGTVIYSLYSLAVNKVNEQLLDRIHKLHSELEGIRATQWESDTEHTD